MALVPCAKLGISNTPAGPFQRMVLDSSRTFFHSAIASGAASMPIHPSGMAFAGHICVRALLSKASAATTVSEKYSLTPFSFAFARVSRAVCIWSSSTSDLPIEPPCAFMKVKTMPPHTIMLSARSSRCSITPIFEDTLAPPRMTVRGRWGLPSTLSMALISPSIT